MFHGSKKTLPQKAVKQVSEYIRKNFRKDIKLDDIAEAVLFFAGEDSGYITGQHIWVDGAMQTGLKAKG